MSKIDWIYSVLLVGLLLVFAPRAHAELTISICGHSSGVMDQSCVDEKAPLGTGAPGTLSGIMLGYPLNMLMIRDAAGNVGRVSLSPTQAIPVPSGWSAPSVSGDPPVPPGTSGTLTKYSCPAVSADFSSCAAIESSPYAEKIAAGVAHCHWANTPDAGRTFSGFVGTYNDVPNCNGYYNESTMRLVGHTLCPAGYTLVGSVCTLSNAALVEQPSDNTVVSTRSGNVYFFSSTDPDNGSVSTSAKSVLAVDGSGGVVAGGNAGQGGAFTVTTGADGKTVIVIARDLGNGSSMVTQLNVGAPNGSGVTALEGLSSGTYAGTGNLAGGSPVGQTELGPGSTPCGAPGQAPCKIDETGTDMSAGGSAQSTARGILDTISARITAATGSGQASDLIPGVGNLSLPTTVPSQWSFFGNYFPQFATCQPIAGPTTGHLAGMSINICPAADVLRPILEWFVYLLTMIVIFQMWFRQEHQVRT